MMRRRPHRRCCAALFLLLCAVPAIAANPVYSWKDADGRFHFSDKPPPRGTTLIRGPAASRPADESCPPGALPADCRTMRDALHEDLDTLTTDAHNARAGSAASRPQQDADAARIIATECADLRAARAALERRRDGRSSEILTDAERQAASPQALEQEIAQIDRKLAQLCR